MIAPSRWLGCYRILTKASMYCRPVGSRGVATGSAATYTPPSLANITARWPVMKNAELQEEIKEYLDWKMMGPWQEMTKDEMTSAYFIAYGAWGPRAKAGKGKTAQPTQQVNVSYFIFRVLFNVTLLAALGVAYINWKHDKEHQKAPDEVHQTE